MRKLLRIMLTVLMYAGVAIFLYPYFRGTLSTGVVFMIVGGGAAVVFGLLRGYLTEGDCSYLPQHHRY